MNLLLMNFIRSLRETWPIISMAGCTEAFPSFKAVYPPDRIHAKLQSSPIAVFTVSIINMITCFMILASGSVTGFTPHSFRFKLFITAAPCCVASKAVGMICRIINPLFFSNNHGFVSKEGKIGSGVRGGDPDCILVPDGIFSMALSAHIHTHICKIITWCFMSKKNKCRSQHSCGRESDYFIFKPLYIHRHSLWNLFIQGRLSAVKKK